MPFLRLNALVLCLYTVFDKAAVESGDGLWGEAAICADGEEHKGDAVFCKAAETGICAAAGDGFEVEGGPHIDDADIGVGIKAFGKFGALVQHVALDAFLRGKPSEQAFAVGVAIFAGTLG